MESKQDGKANRMGRQIEWEGQQDGKANRMQSKQDEKANRMGRQTEWKAKQDGKVNRIERQTGWRKANINGKVNINDGVNAHRMRMQTRYE